ncbi:unnamed protein product, partial [Lymnaea stagnalis]
MGITGFSGIVFNGINVAVYLKMGLGDTVNITLLGLALADLGSSVVLVLLNCFSYPDLIFDYLPVSYLITWLHIGFTRVSSCLTAYITVERYLCVALPLKVKSIITPRRTACIVSGIFAAMMSSMILPFFATRIDSVSNPFTNRSTLSLKFIPNGQELERASVTINNVSILSSFPSVTLCTCLLIFKLLSKTKWRNTISSSAKNETMAVRDLKVVRMITSISCVFIASYLPVAVITAAMLAYPELSVTGDYSNVLTVVWCVATLLEGVNATTGIFVYMKMSSKY